MEVKYKRVLIKLSGEALVQGAPETEGKRPIINYDFLKTVCEKIKKCVDWGCEVAVVVGAGNIWRGKEGVNFQRVRADHMGMLATTINSLALCDALEQLGVTSRVQTAIEMRHIAEPYIRNKAIRHLEKGRVVIFGCGTGNPFFSTDTAAALRAAEIGADVIFKATNVDGVYDKDPNKFSDAVRYDELTHSEVLSKGLAVMDASASSMCRDNGIAILVFNLSDPENILRAVRGERVGTLVK